MYKLSSYNFFIAHGDKTICFNGVSRFIFALNEQEYKFLKTSLDDLPNFETKFPTYFSFLKSKLFIVEENLNEFDYIRFLNRQDIFLNNRYRIIINPTLECNFKCWYCYEEHPKGHISMELMNKIIQHIEYVVDSKQIGEIDLSWFGGEPLLYFDEIVYPISKAAKNILKKNKLVFSNHATTNAYLINEQMVKKFKEIDLDSFQITIDGSKEEHNKIRNALGSPSFEKIMNNIRILCESNKKAHVLLRINYTDKTLENIETIFEEIPLNIKNQISIGFHRVWQTVSENNDQEIKNKIIHIIDETIKRGFQCSYPESFSHEYISCYADRFWHTEINYDGNVYKCTMDYSKEPHGKILENGIIEWNKSSLASLYSQSTFENEMCKKCKLLPICLGPCSRKMSETHGCSSCLGNICNMKTSEIGYENLILNHYKYLLRKHEKRNN